MSATLITVATTGAESSKAQAPTLPVTLDELVEAAVACEDAGAAMIHVHIRDDGGVPTLDLGRLRETVAALRASTSLILQLSTGGSVHDPFTDRLRVLDAEPESCSLTCGTVNFGSDVFSNPWPFMAELYQEVQARGVVPEFELFDLGHVASMNRLLDKFGPPPGRLHCDLVMGVPGGMPATPQALVAALAMIPAEASWSATGVGRRSLPIMLTALACGGQLRTGMEDVLTFAPDEPVRDNAQLVERAAALARLAQRPPMSTGEARAHLGIAQRVG
jgi:uncharacterized protein (DUF849 family)